MLVDGVLQLFPPHGLDQSILVAVWMGIFVLLFLTEMFGWVFVGLVVPGYLSSIAIIHPASAVAVLFESLLTYVLCRLLSETLSVTRAWSPYFGRERFLLIVMVSVFVRQNSQIWLLPMLLRYFDESFGTTMYTDLDFYSIGLVLIPLTANMCWKLGVLRGCLQIGVPTAIVYSILTFVLLPYTNLSFGNLALTYENVALDFLGSPKAYMILLTGSFLAAHYNVKYGWDYNGIMVPSLLALAWFTPALVLVTLIEALFLFGLTRLALMTPMLRMLNLEGPRKVSLIFTLGFFTKYVVGWVLALSGTEYRITDFLGFGYVLTSLIAVKMVNVRTVGRVILPTAQVSLVSFVVGSLIGYGLEQIAPTERPSPPIAERQEAATQMLVREPLGVMAVAEVRARPSLPAEIRDGRSRDELKTYACLWRGVDGWLESAARTPPAAVRMCARDLRLGLRRLERGFTPGQLAFALVDEEERLALQTGWDTALLFPGAPGPYIEVPSPRLEAPAVMAAAFLCQSLRCRGILVSGGDSRQNTAANALVHPRAPFQVAHRQLNAAPVIQLRADERVARGRPVLHLKHTLPPTIDLRQLWSKDVELSWQPPPESSQQWGTRSDVVVLRVNPEDLWARLLAASPAPMLPREGVDLESYLVPLVERPEPAKPVSSNDPADLGVILPSESELRFLETLLADDLLQGRWDRMPWLSRLANLIDYHIVFLPDCAGPEDGCWVLSQRDTATRYPMGVLAVRTGDPAPLAIEVPRPERETGVFRLGAELWAVLRGHAFLINPDEKLSGSGMRLDPTIIGNPVTPFHAVHQAIHRALIDRHDKLGPDAPSGLILQLRGFAGWRAVDSDMVIGMGPPVMQPWQIPARLAPIVAQDGPLGWLHDSMRYVDGSEELGNLGGQGTPQITYSRAVGGVDMALVWLSERVRQRYRPASRAHYEEQLQKSGFTLTDGSVHDALRVPPLDPPRPLRGRRQESIEAEFERMVDLAMHYAATRDIHVLRALRSAGQGTPGLEVQALWSTQMSLPFLRIQAVHNDLVLRAAVLLHTVEEASCVSRNARALGLGEHNASQLLRRCGVITEVGAPAGGAP